MRLTLSINFLQRLFTSLVLGAAFWAIYFYLPPVYFSLALAVILTSIILFEWKRLFKVSTPAFWLTMPLYPILPFTLLIYLNHNPMYHSLLFILFIVVFSFDTGSYVIGTLFGRHHFSSISKNKTWEGVFGGYVFACVGLALLLHEKSIYKSWFFICAMTALITALALIGDLFESWLKRRAHIKDSGTYLPGHGGFLDRFDGILFAVFFFFLLRDFLAELFFLR